MKWLFEMLFDAVVESEENDVDLRQRLDECTALACAYADAEQRTRTTHVGMGEALSSGEIIGLLWESSAPQTDLLLPGLAPTLTWFLALSLCCGAPMHALVDAKVDDVRLDERGLRLRVGDSPWAISLVVAGVGFFGYLEGLRASGQHRLFPGLATVRGRETLDRFLAGRRVAAACGRPSGLVLADLRATYEEHAYPSRSDFASKHCTAVVSGVFAIEWRLRDIA